jgi:two-component system OmpR family response regulator
MTRTMKVLLVEDNEQVAHFVCKGLQEAGNSVDHVGDGAAGVALAGAGHYDAVIMDRMLPGAIDGLGVIAALRRAGNDVPILILSSVAGVDERIRGLNGGADDYLVKPFAFGELVARLEALVRRASGTPAASVLTVGDLVLNLLTRKVTRADKPVALRPQEFKLLAYLMQHANQVVTRTMLLEHVWDYHFDPRTNVIDVHVSKLRAEIDRGAAVPLLRTIRSVGYMLSANAP